MNIVERITGDKEIQELKKLLYEITGNNLGFNYDCYFGIDEYKQHLRDCVAAKKMIIRPADEAAMNRFADVWEQPRAMWPQNEELKAQFLLIQDLDEYNKRLKEFKGLSVDKEILKHIEWICHKSPKVKGE